MEVMDLDLEYFFIYNPTLVPDNPKASEVEMMDAKKIFFYPTLVDINKQRNLMGMGEGFVSFYNTFRKIDEDADNRDVQVMAFDRRVMISKCIDNDNYIVMIMKHGFGNEKENKHKVINRVSKFNVAIYKRLLDRFCKVYRTIFEPVQYYISSQENLVEFTENILRFIESYFFVEEAHKESKKSINVLSKLFGDLIVKRKLTNSITLPIVRTIIELKNDYPNFYDLMAFKSSYLIYTGLTDDIAQTLISLLFDMDIKSSRSIESKQKITFSRFFENFYDLEFLDSLTKTEYTLTETRSKKHLSFNIPVTSNSETKYYKFYTTFIIHNDMLILLLLKNKSASPALLTRLKSIPKLLNTPFTNDQPKSKNIYLGFFNILNQSITNAIDMTGLAKMRPGEILLFASTFFSKQENGEKNEVYFYYMVIGETAVAFNLVNGRITWIYSTDIDRYDVIDEFCLLRENVKTIVL